MALFIHPGDPMKRRAFITLVAGAAAWRVDLFLAGIARPPLLITEGSIPDHCVLYKYTLGPY
jgi:hypothetical protein